MKTLTIERFGGMLSGLFLVNGVLIGRDLAQATLQTSLFTVVFYYLIDQAFISLY